MFFEILKAFIIGLVEGITEWLPISSTGHMILVDEFLKLNVSSDFLSLFLVVIQIGAIMAVIILYFRKLNPFALSKTSQERHATWRLWGMVVVGCLPAAVIGILFDDLADKYLFKAPVVAAMLILYGIVFIVIEGRNRRMAKSSQSAVSLGKHARVSEDVELVDLDKKAPSVDDITPSIAFKIGLFQCLDRKSVV